LYLIGSSDHELTSLMCAYRRKGTRSVYVIRFIGLNLCFSARNFEWHTTTSESYMYM